MQTTDSTSNMRPAQAARGPAAGLMRLVTGRLTLDDLWLVTPLAMAFIFLLNLQIHPADFWWHVRIGQIIAQTGQIPTTDLFTFTRAGETWINQGWLMQTWLYLLLRAGGLPLILFAHAVVISAGYLLVELACLRMADGQPRAAALATVAAMAVGIVHWNVRPQSASYLCFGVVVYVLTRRRAGRTRLLWVLPPLFALWVNLHGGFIFGLGLLAIHAVMRAVEEWLTTRRLSRDATHLLAATGASALALALNPGGPMQAVRYVLGFLQSSITVQKNLEFQPLSIREADGLLFFVVLLLFLAAFWRRRASLAADQLASLVIFGLASLYARRIVPWYGMALGPVLAWTLARRPADPTPALRPGRPGLNYALLGLMVCCAVLLSPWTRPYVPPPFSRSHVVEDFNPEQAAAVLCRLGPTARPFANISFASYLEWACPAVLTFMDTRFELYPAAMWLDYIRITNGLHDWEERLVGYGVNALFVQKESEYELIRAAKRSGHWETIYEDAWAIVLLRRDAAGQ